MRFKYLLTILCLLAFAAMAQAALAQDAPSPGSGAQGPDESSETPGTVASHPAPASPESMGEGYRMPPGWTLIAIAFLTDAAGASPNAVDADGAREAEPGTRGASWPVRITSEGMGAFYIYLADGAGGREAEPGTGGELPNWCQLSPGLCVSQAYDSVQGPERGAEPGTRGSPSDAADAADVQNAEPRTGGERPPRCLDNPDCASRIFDSVRSSGPGVEPGPATRGERQFRCQFQPTKCAFQAFDSDRPSKPGTGPGTRGAAADAASPDSDAVNRLTLGLRLAALGRETKSPYVLAAAADLMASAAAVDSDTGKAGIEGDPAPAGSVPTDEPVTDPGALFAEAAQLARAASNDQLAAQLELSAAAAGSRSPVGRSARHRDRVDPYATDVYTVRFRGGETAAAAVAADSRYDLDLYVYNDSGNLVSYDNDTTSIGICSWYPGRTKDYFLAVKNATGSYVSYLLYTN